MTTLARLLTFLAAAVAGTAAADDAKPTKLDGTYTIVKGEHDGTPIPDGRIKGSVVTFTGDKVVGTDKDKKEFFAATYKLDTSAKPWKISMTSTAPKDGGTSEGVVEADGDTVKLCYALPGGDTPTEFKTKAKQQCFTLKRAAKAGR